jgi:hypothetical protein
MTSKRLHLTLAGLSNARRHPRGPSGSQGSMAATFLIILAVLLGGLAISNLRQRHGGGPDRHRQRRQGAGWAAVVAGEVEEYGRRRCDAASPSPRLRSARQPKSEPARSAGRRARCSRCAWWKPPLESVREFCGGERENGPRSELTSQRLAPAGGTSVSRHAVQPSRVQ